MPKESESLNHKDNSNSKMIAIPPNSQVEEVLISDEEQQTEQDTQPYEQKLYEKLRDLGLYEDGMTIQQMEELLAVVFASWETAEEEKTRRQFYQDYMTASEAFCNDQIEFTFKESPECSNQASLFSANSQYLDIPVPTDSSNVPSYSKDTKTTRPLTPNGDINQTRHVTKDRTSNSSIEMCENDTNCNKPSYELLTSSGGKSKSRRGRSKKSRLANSQSTANIRRVKESRLFSKQPKKELGQCFSVWKPCLSPKDTPLVCSKKPWLSEPESSRPETEEEYTKKIFDLVKEMDKARSLNLQRFPPDRTLSKPYYLTRRVHFTKKSSKPDKMDVMVGVATKKPALNIDGKVIKEPFSRTSGGAFRYVNRNRSNMPRNFESQTTRSGMKYGRNATELANATKTKLACANESYVTVDSAVMDGVILNSSHGAESPSHLFSEVEVILDEDLPKFNHLRPDIYGDFLFDNDVSSQVNNVESGSKGDSSKSKNHSLGESSGNLNHIGNSTCADNDSSDGSSVIDVETVVDDEVEEFVLKRKMLQEFQSTEKEPNTSQSKRLKKTAL